MTIIITGQFLRLSLEKSANDVVFLRVLRTVPIKLG